MISIVIPTHKPKYLLEVLSALQYQSFRNFEVIVCENPEITEEVKKIVNIFYGIFRIKHVNSSLGANNARNTGIAHAEEPIIALLDDDCEANSYWLEHINNTLSDSKVSCVGGRVDLEINEPISSLEAQYLTKISWGNTKTYRPLIDGEYIASCNLAFTKEVYNKVGGFNSNLGYFGKDNFIPNDEVLFIRDCKNHGLVVYNDNMSVNHLVQDRVNKKFFLKRAYGQGYANVLLAREQGETNFMSVEKIYHSKYYNTDIDLQIAKNIGTLHALKGIEPSEQFYLLLEELVQI